MRSLYLIGLFYLGVGGYAYWRGSGPVILDPVNTVVDTGSQEWTWFQSAKPYCNTLEVETIHRQLPPTQSLEGVGYSAACFALAGKVDQSRSIILSLPESARWKAAGIVFDIGHPIADMGDDRSAGPIMELVLEFWPNHYQALYHAGASSYAMGQHDNARHHLGKFLRYYDIEDGFTRNARTMLRRIRAL